MPRASTGVSLLQGDPAYPRSLYCDSELVLEPAASRLGIEIGALVAAKRPKEKEIHATTQDLTTLQPFDRKIVEIKCNIMRE